MNTPTRVLFEALICLLKTSLVENPDKELKEAKIKYVESTIKAIEELLK